MHQPLIPGRNEAWKDEIDKGAVRSIWTQGDPMKFDVAFHDPSQGFTPNGTAEFSKAIYHAAVQTLPDNRRRQQQRQQGQQQQHDGQEQQQQHDGQEQEQHGQ
jgi:hypothetical protein